MEFREKLLSSHFTLDENIEIFESVQQKRAEALKVFEQKGFPSKREESWKYTSLQGLIGRDYAIFPKACAGPRFARLAARHLPSPSKAERAH